MIGGIEQPGIAGLGGEQDERADRYQSPVMLGGAALDVVDFVGEFEVLAVDASPSRSAFDDSPAQGGCSLFVRVE
jgi:hypothetical protein